MYEINIKLIEELIRLQRSSLKLYIAYTAAIVLIGMLLLVSGQLLFENSTLKSIISSGGTIITSFSGFSLKEFLNKKENINLYNTFKSSIEIYRDNAQKQKQFEATLQNFLFKK